MHGMDIFFKGDYFYSFHSLLISHDDNLNMFYSDLYPSVLQHNIETSLIW